MPVVGPFRRPLLEYLVAAFGAEDVVAEAEIFVKNEATLRDPLLAIAALDVAWIVRGFCFVLAMAVCGDVGIEWRDFDREGFR